MRPKFARVPRTAKFDPVGFLLGQVGPLLSPLSYSLGAGGSRPEAIRIINGKIDHIQFKRIANVLPTIGF